MAQPQYDQDGFRILKPKSYTMKKKFEKKNPDNLIIFRHSHIAITNYKMGDNWDFEKSLSVYDEVNWKYRRMAGHYVKEFHEFRLPRSYDTSLLAKFFPDYRPIVENDAYPSDTVDIKLLVPPRDDEQRVGLSFLCCQGDFKKNARYTTLMVDSGTGSGKAQPDDTLVPTPTGLRRLDELEIGDEVFNLDGKPVKVTGIFPQKGKQDTYEVTLKDGRKTRCNGEHLWYVLRPRGVNYSVLSLNEIKKKYKDEKRGHTQNLYSVPMPGALHYEKQDVPIDPYVLGAFIGNGCLSDRPLTISSGNFEVLVEIAKIIGCPTHFRRHDNYSYTFFDKEYSGRYFRGKKKVQTKDFFREIPELIGSKSHTKFIPDIYKYNSIKVRRALLQGLMDTDGHISLEKYRVSYTTVSKQLCDDIVELVRSLGYGASVSEDNRTSKYVSGHCYHIHIMCPDEDKVTLFRVNRKSKNRAILAKDYKTRNSRTHMNIVDIKKVKPTKQRCIMIDDPRHVYITENFIPTHNTYMTTAATCFLQARTVIISPISKLLEQWKNSYLEFTSLKEEDILIVSGSGKKKGQDICWEILRGEHQDKKVFIFMVDTLVTFQKKNGDLATIELLRATNAYVKIMDEIHREMKAMTMIDALSNFHMNYYASATPDRSDKKEKWIFKSCYRNCPRFGSKFKTSDEKWTNIMVVRYSFTPTPDQIKRMVHPRKKWLNTKAYEKELFEAPAYQQESFINTFTSMLRWSKNLIKEDNKILILCATVAGTEFLKNIAEEIYPGEVSCYHGKLRPKQKAEAETYRVICATADSLGTGADIKGIQHVYNVKTYTNSIDAGQLPGRARKLPDGTSVYYIELVNFSYLKCVKQYETRKPYLVKASRNGKILLVE